MAALLSLPGSGTEHLLDRLYDRVPGRPIRLRYSGLFDLGKSADVLLLELLTAMHRRHEDRPFHLDNPRVFADVHAAFLVSRGRIPEAFAEVLRGIAALYPVPERLVHVRACPHAVAQALGTASLPDVLSMARLMDTYLSDAPTVQLNDGVLHGQDAISLDRACDAVRRAVQASSSLSEANVDPASRYEGANRL
jgi:hypothetical protein